MLLQFTLEDDQMASIDNSGNVTVILHKLNRVVSIKPVSPAIHLAFIGTPSFSIPFRSLFISFSLRKWVSLGRL